VVTVRSVDRGISQKYNLMHSIKHSSFTPKFTHFYPSKFALRYIKLYCTSHP